MVDIPPPCPLATVLLVDGNAPRAAHSTAALEALGFAVIGAASPQGALDALASGRPAAVLVHLATPGNDALALVREVRRREALWHAPHQIVIALTDGSFEADHALALAEGMDDFIEAPLRAERLLAALARHATT